mmetsp:Transcript_20197/g.63797  ORF Transcript_20197/g.63797 Transcript_20197/m.63797 type:complete len:357 (-) Transcript_20197:458-1528(-)
MSSLTPCCTRGSRYLLMAAVTGASWSTASCTLASPRMRVSAKAWLTAMCCVVMVSSVALMEAAGSNPSPSATHCSPAVAAHAPAPAEDGGSAPGARLAVPPPSRAHEPTALTRPSTFIPRSRVTTSTSSAAAAPARSRWGEGRSSSSTARPGFTPGGGGGPAGLRGARSAWRPSCALRWWARALSTVHVASRKALPTSTTTSASLAKRMPVGLGAAGTCSSQRASAQPSSWPGAARPWRACDPSPGRPAAPVRPPAPSREEEDDVSRRSLARMLSTVSADASLRSEATAQPSAAAASLARLRSLRKDCATPTPARTVCHAHTRTGMQRRRRAHEPSVDRTSTRDTRPAAAARARHT